jgi:hypothetical protein
LRTSSFPDELKRRGYPLKEIAGGSRILHTAYHQPMQIAANGVLEPAVQGSTRPISTVVHGAGPQPTRRYEFPAPFRTGR